MYYIKHIGNVSKRASPSISETFGPIFITQSKIHEEVNSDSIQHADP